MVLLIFLQPPIGILEKRRAAQPPIGILYIYNGFMIFMIFVDFSSTPHQPFAKMAPHNPPLGYPIITMVLVLLSLPQPPIGTSTGCSQDAPMTSPERPQDAPRTLPGRSQARPKGAFRQPPIGILENIASAQPPIGILEKRRSAQPPIGILYNYNGFMTCIDLSLQI